MRVLMVSDVYFPRVNGVSTAIQTCRRTLAGHGVEVRLVAPDYGGACGEPWISRVPSRPVPRDPEDRLMRRSALREAVAAEVARGCDLVHIQTPFLAHYAGHRAASGAGIPVIATYHTLFEEYLQHYAPFVPAGWLRGMARRFSRAQCNALDAVIVPSQAVRQRLAGYGVTAPLHVRPTGVPAHRLNPRASAGRDAFRARYGIDPARPVALFVGRVAHEKNIGFLLDVADLARASLPDLLLLVAGEGPALAALRAAVAARGLAANVRFLGYLDRGRELPECYAAADVFVFASRTETQGLVLLEAMAAGLPVVALAAMGTLDILGARRGALVPPDDPAAFAADLLALLRDDALRRRLARDARDTANEWLDETLAGRMAELYRHMVIPPGISGS
ncbi:MAG: glycosyltransferase [Betaproteobacteria bacterium]|nr:glycosyltransferase [Betaproteobacteria bacterium]